MSSDLTERSATQNGMIYAKNPITNKMERIAFATGVQIGMPSTPTDLQVIGGLSLTSAFLELNAGSTQQIDAQTTFFLIKTIGNSGQVVVNLPNNPRIGHILSIKDMGNASSVAIDIFAATNQKIENSSAAYSINTSYGFIQLVWSGTEQGWVVLSTTPKALISFGGTTISAGPATRYLYPNGSAAASVAPVYIIAPAPGTLRNLYIRHNSTTVDVNTIAYSVYINGSTTSLSVTLACNGTTANNTSDRVVVAQGDQITLRAVVSGGVATPPANIIASLELIYQ